MDIKLAPQLFDLLQHCEIKCNAECCGWDAFDFTNDWLVRWRDAREASSISAAQNEISRVQDLLQDLELESKVRVQRSFESSVASLAEHFSMIEKVLAVDPNTRDNLQR